MRTTFIRVGFGLASCVVGVGVHGPNDLPGTGPAGWLDRRIRDEVAGFSGSVSLFAKNLDSGVYSFGGDDRVRTASTIKVAIMIEAFARIAEGKAN